jgi:transcription antitermination factor NusG
MNPWYCIRTWNKQEALAAQNLRLLELDDVFLPRVRFRLFTRRGPVWFLEALFPCYLFARLDLGAHLRAVEASRGVVGLIHFGTEIPTIADGIMAELKRHFPTDEPLVLPDAFVVGHSVHVVAGPLRGLDGVLKEFRPARERAVVLMDFLGRSTPTDLHAATVKAKRHERLPAAAA